MIIIPAIDLRGGNCVRLYQGDYKKETIYDTDPVSVALEWKSQGATNIHIVDLDGSKAGTPVNNEIVFRIFDATRLPIQVGGGIRTVEDVKQYIEKGISQVIIGTTAIENKQKFQEMLDVYKDHIIVSLDVKNGMVMTAGWLEGGTVSLETAVQSLQQQGVESFIVTDITRDSTMKGPNLDLYRDLRKKITGTLILAGGIGSDEDVRNAIKTGVDGVVVGKALYEHTVHLRHFQ